MRKTFILTTLVFFYFFAQAQDSPDQRGEFATQDNGLMYSNAAMQKLRMMVEKQNIIYKRCDLNKPYYAFPQSRMITITFSSKTENLKNVIADLKANKPLEYYIQKYPSYIKSMDSNRLIIQTKSKEDPYLSGSPEHGYNEFYSKQKLEVGIWSYDYDVKDKYTDAYSVDATLLRYPFASQIIPKVYASQILYVDCMVDTNAFLMLGNRSSNPWSVDEKESKVLKSLSELGKYIASKMPKKTYNAFDETKANFAVTHLQNDKQFLALFDTVVQDYSKNGEYHPTLEYLADALNDDTNLLLMKRCHRVMGFCSMDTRPREHALEIAKLAGETQSWDIFLRAHLDIMNDRFERASDGSYAWGRRGTYLKELEELNLNVVDLMLGMSLRSSSVALNHYNGTVWRLGKALAESKEQEHFETEAMKMMKDIVLDEFNRGLIFILYHSYLNSIAVELRNTKVVNWKKQASEFPKEIETAILKLKDEVKKEG
jgi:hypothetical protein